MKVKRKPLIPYLLLGTLLAYIMHRAYVLYSMAPEPDITNLFKPYAYVLEKITERPYFYWNTSPLALLAALVGFFYHLSSPSRYLTKNILSLVIQIRKLFYFGLKFSEKSVYKSNTLC
ncbi:hypothetical protein Sp14A_09170 [Streptococcus pluranimalium]|uniref:Uncharacterized protein n=1 Tax=Streptococcus pluranimalium TaxID=82348 RepID=A0A345VJD6_9STRE|nr:hypothetical protein Sp14A_09170 [Streptococcus pluranimalium]